MLKFRINAKDFKAAIDKIMSAVPKNTYMYGLRCIKIQVENEVLFLSASDTETFVRCNTHLDYESHDGEILVDSDDLKIITKLSGLLTVSEDEGKLKIVTGKKVVRIPLQDLSIFPEFPSFTDMETMGEICENEFLDAIKRLEPFLNGKQANKMMNSFNVDFSDKRIYVIDGYRIGWANIVLKSDYTERTWVLDGEYSHIYKKIMDKKSDDPVFLCRKKGYIGIAGKTFTFVQKQIDGKYFDIDNFMKHTYEREYVIKMDSLYDSVKYGCGIKSKSDKVPMIMQFNDVLQIYINNGRCESLDRIAICKTNSSETSSLLIGFNPYFWNDILSIMDDEDIVLMMDTAKSPCMIAGSKYGSIILPVSLDKTPALLEKFHDMIA